MKVLKQGVIPPPKVIQREGYPHTCGNCQSELIVENRDFTGESSYNGCTDKYSSCPICKNHIAIATRRNGKSKETVIIEIDESEQLNQSKKEDEWKSVYAVLPPFGLIVQVYHTLGANSHYEASLFDNDYHANQNGGRPRFLVNDNSKIIFVHPEMWRFKQTKTTE